jgi:hypothetical protein
MCCTAAVDLLLKLVRTLGSKGSQADGGEPGYEHILHVRDIRKQSLELSKRASRAWGGRENGKKGSNTTTYAGLPNDNLNLNNNSNNNNNNNNKRVSLVMQHQPPLLPVVWGSELNALLAPAPVSS